MIEGYLVLSKSVLSPYRGVDRKAFSPVITDEMLNAAAASSPGTKRKSAWEYAQTTWEREAFRLFEEHLVQNAEDFELISDETAAKRIRDLIEPYRGQHEVVLAQVMRNGDHSANWEGDKVFLGYDVAYPGGDYYSAILNGLFCNPHPALSAAYRTKLNRSGLFDDRTPALSYLKEFRAVVSSERNSDFVLLKLFSCG